MSTRSAFLFAAVLGAAVLLAASVATATPVNETYISPPNQTLWQQNIWYVVRNDSNGTMNVVPFDYTIKSLEGEYAAATMIYNESLADLGWDYVQVEGNGTLLRNTEVSLTPLAVGGGNWTGNRRDAYYVAGLLEGFVTAKRLWDVYTVQGIYQLNASAVQWIDKHIAFMRANADAAWAQPLFADGDFDDVFNQTYWRKVGDILAQLQGIADGVSREGTHNLTFRDVFYLNFNDEIMDVILATQDSSVSVATLRAHDRRSHCSALVKNNGSDIFFSHVTWGGYNTMVRQYKTYSFETKVSMTSIAGTVMSGDDWYMTNNSLAVQETTNEYYGSQLAKDYVVPNSVSEFIRVMVANYIAADGSRWAKLFVYNNDGCYCNQYMVLNSKIVNLTRSKEEDKIPPHSLTVVEQMPGDYGVADFSASLRNKGYFGSYNIPVIPKIFVNSGFAAQEALYGTFFSHDQTPRALIFARNQSFVKDLASMKTMMRFNHWTTDPLSAIPNCTKCTPNSPWLAIASRGDLVPANATLPAAPAYAGYFEQSPNGAIDAKITSVEMIKTLTGHVINGPTSDTQPVFAFSTSPFPAVRPPSSPDRFNFNWVAFTYASFLPPKVEPYFPFAAAVVGVIVGLIMFVFVLYIIAEKCCVTPAKSEDGAYAKL